MQSDLTEFYKKQISLTEWFEAIKHPDAAKLKVEDNDKRECLGILNELIGLPYDKPAQFSAKDVAKRSPAFKKYLAGHGKELCAVRAMPTDPTLPKLRMRGHTVEEGTRWLDEQALDPEKYRIDFVPHFEPEWSTIFVVNQKGVFGDITQGWHYKLTQGTPEGMETVGFRYDFSKWNFSKPAPGAKAHLAAVLKLLRVPAPGKQQELAAKLGATFARDYLCGYFETTYHPDFGIVFIDYNRLLTELTPDVSDAQSKGLVTGRCGSPGQATGKVRIVPPDEVATAELAPDEILVCQMTTPDYVRLMRQAAAIVTDHGGVLSHAAIIARELKKPCVTGTGSATQTLKNGQAITVIADSGSIISA